MHVQTGSPAIPSTPVLAARSRAIVHWVQRSIAVTGVRVPLAVADVLLLANNTDGLLLADGSSYLNIES